MQRNRGHGDPFFDFGNPFAGFGGFGGFADHGSLLHNFFGGRDPFDDPFFQRPFGGMFQPSIFGPSGNPLTDGQASGFLDHQHQVSHPNRSSGPIIEELNSDDEREREDKNEKHNPRKHGRSDKEPYIEDPDDETEGRRSKQIQYMNDFSRVNNTHSQTKTHSFSFQSSSISYGGPDGAYYTSSRTRRTGSDGLTFEESKEADTAAGQASHRVSRGIRDKGHTVDRKLNSDGRVDTMQMLHNLNEEELSGFHEAWEGNARKHVPGWNEGFIVNGGLGTGGQMGTTTRGGWALPSTERIQRAGNMRPNTDEGACSFQRQHSGRMRADVGGRTTSRGRGRSATAFNKDHARRH